MFQRSIKKFFSQTRSSKFKILDQSDINYFQTILQPQQILQGIQQTAPYNQCYLKKYYGHSSLILKPSNTEQVSKILKYCNDNLLAVVPQGGNTGLVGGSVPVFDQIIMNLRNFNKIEKFDPVSGVLSCQTGCVLEKLNQYLGNYGYQIPLDLGSKGSCHIGGNASTHAGGKYFIKHGPFRAHILGLQTVLADGKVLDMRSTIRKDNTGYDLKQLFIGAQGTLGIITKLDINCVKIDTNKQVMLLKTKSFNNIIKMVQAAKKTFGKNLNALEYLDGFCYKSVTKHLHPSVMEVSLEDHLLLLQITTDNLEPFFNQEIQYDDSIISTNQKQYRAIWKIREDIIQAANKQGQVSSYDFSFNIKQWNNMVQKARKQIGGYLMGYGHIGDGNLHLNICLQRGKEVNQQSLFEEVIKNKGSISAEHGIGHHKSESIKSQRQKEVLGLCNNIRHIFDKNGILNPYKVHV